MSPRTLGATLAVGLLCVVLAMGASALNPHSATLTASVAWNAFRLVVVFVLGWLAAFLSVVFWRSPKVRGYLEKCDPLWKPHLIRAALVSVAVVAVGWLGTLGLCAAGRLPFDWRWVVMGLGVVITVYLLIDLRKILFPQVQWAFLVVALGAGTCLCLVMPASPSIAPDGAIHFNNSLALSFLANPRYSQGDVAIIGLYNGVMVRTDVDSEGNPVGTPYTDDEVTSGAVNLPSTPSNPVPGVEMGTKVLGTDMSLEGDTTTREALDEMDSGSAEVQMEGDQRLGGGAILTPSRIGYLPQATGLWLGRILDMDILGELTLARFCSMATLTVFYFLAMASLKSGKLVVATMALLPESLFLACNFSYDPWLTALTTLALARYVGFLQDKGRTMDVGYALSIAVPFVLGVLVKAVYLPLGLVFLVIPKDRFPSVRARLAYGAFIVVLAIGVFLTFLIPLVAPAGGSNALADTRGGSDVNGLRQIQHILAHPMAYMETLGNFFQWFFSPAISMSFGSLIGYVLDHSGFAWNAGLYSYGLLLVLALIDRGPDDRAVNRAGIKLTTLVGVILALLASITALYLTYTPVGSPDVGGMQGRYMLPLFMPVFLVLLDFPALGRPMADPRRARTITAVAMGCLVVLAFAVPFFRFGPLMVGA